MMLQFFSWKLEFCDDDFTTTRSTSDQNTAEHELRRRFVFARRNDYVHWVENDSLNAGGRIIE